MIRGRNKIRHSFQDGSRGAAKSSSAKPPSSNPSGNAGDVSDPDDADETTITPVPVENNSVVVISDLQIFRPYDPRYPLLPPIYVEGDEYPSRGGIEDAEAYDPTLVYVSPNEVPYTEPVDRDRGSGNEWDKAFVETLFPGSGMEDTNDMADSMIKAGVALSLPGMPTAFIGIPLQLSGDAIKDLNQGDFKGAIANLNPEYAVATDQQSGFVDRGVKTGGMVGLFLTGDPSGAYDSLKSHPSDVPERKPSEHIEAVGETSEKNPDSIWDSIVRQTNEGDLGKLFGAASKFDSESDRVRSLPGIRIVESDRYYTVFFYPRKGITYIEWKPTEDIKNLISKSRKGDTFREWSEDFIAAAGFRVPAWSKRVKYVKEKYGFQSDSVKHYGYSRGGGLATHLGGTGYGTGYFAPYSPSPSSKSKLSGDVLHDMLINPMSYFLLMRRRPKF